ncbi:MAG TPA: hypothetical protein VIN67_07520, partial [Desulfobaccales bacterium]
DIKCTFIISYKRLQNEYDIYCEKQLVLVARDRGFVRCVQQWFELILEPLTRGAPVFWQWQAVALKGARLFFNRRGTPIKANLS